MRLAAALVALLLSAPVAVAVALPPLGEAPADWRCNDGARRVCAGIAADGWATCGLAADRSASCSWSYGFLSRAWSTEHESGRETHEGAVEVTRCSSMRGCAVLDAWGFEASCEWIAVLACEESRGAFTGATTFGPLVLGECLKLMVRTSGGIEATVAGVVDALPQEPAIARFHALGEAGGEVCFVDDGR